MPDLGEPFTSSKTPLKEPALYVFGNGTTPDILTRYYLGRQRSDYPLNYAFNTAGEITQGILAGKSKSCRARGTVSKHRFTERQQLTNNCGLESLNRQRYPRIRPNSGRIHPDDGEISYRF